VALQLDRFTDLSLLAWVPGTSLLYLDGVDVRVS
jgi:hypothetical protein